MSEVLAQLEKQGGGGGNIDFSKYSIVESAGGSGQGTKTLTTQADDIVIINGGGSGSTIGGISNPNGLAPVVTDGKYIVGIATGTTVTFTANAGYGAYHCILRKS